MSRTVNWYPDLRFTDAWIGFVLGEPAFVIRARVDYAQNCRLSESGCWYGNPVME